MESQLILGITIGLYLGMSIGLSIGLVIRSVMECLSIKIRNWLKKVIFGE